MLIEIVNTPSTAAEDKNTQPFRMERPKSAKYNLERYKKSSAYASRFNKLQNLDNNNTNSSNVITLTSQTPQLIEESNTSFNTSNINNNLISNSTISSSNSNSKRFQTSKSAYVGNVSKIRPQSARHNLEKYRQDVLREQQRKLQKLQQLQQIQNQTPTLIDENNVNLLISNNLNLNKEPVVDQEIDEDDIDNLEGLLIREEESSSELESNDSLSNTDLTVIKTTKHKKHNGNKKKLLSKRTGSNSNTVITVGPQVIVNSTNLPNKNANLNHYTTFRPTAVTTNYSTSLNKSQLISNSNLFQQQQQQQQQQQPNQTYSKIVHLHPERERDRDRERENYSNDQTLDQTNGSMNTTATTNSSSSSTSSSSKQQQQQHQQQQLQQQHLVSNEHAPIIINRSKNNSNIETTSRELLNEWLKNDDEVDLKIANSNNNTKIMNTNILNDEEDDNMGDDNYIIPNRQHSVIIQKQPLRQQQQNRLLIQQKLANPSGRTSRFSDYSSHSNLNTNNLINSNTASSILNVREKSGFVDPWVKRNPALIAQNVLLKHKAELEQITANRNTNTSRTSNTPSLLTASTAANSTSVSRCLLPDTKYFKK